MKVGVLYVAPGQETQRSVLANSRGSDAFEAFVDGLGAPTDLASHRGFLGGLDPQGTTGPTAPYYASPSTEVIFHVVTRMPTAPDDPQQVLKVRSLAYACVTVC
jgi:hypothetical protein